LRVDSPRLKNGNTTLFCLHTVSLLICLTKVCLLRIIFLSKQTLWIVQLSFSPEYLMNAILGWLWAVIMGDDTTFTN